MVGSSPVSSTPGEQCAGRMDMKGRVLACSREPVFRLWLGTTSSLAAGQ